MTPYEQCSSEDLKKCSSALTTLNFRHAITTLGWFLDKYPNLYILNGKIDYEKPYVDLIFDISKEMRAELDQREQPVIIPSPASKMYEFLK